MVYNPIVNKIQVAGATSAGSVSLPANCVLREVIVQNTNANAITGGLKFGTTSGAVDIAAALAVGANGLVFLTDALMLKRFFSAGSAQSIFYDAVTLWNSANVNITFVYYQL